MYLYGASGHGKVILDILHRMGINVNGFIDANSNLNFVCGLPVVHNSAGLSPLIISIGNNAIRKRIAESLTCPFATAIDPSAIVSSPSRIDCGTVVMHGAIIQTEATIGKHCIVNTGASVDHECVIGDFVHISPHATLCGNVHVGEGSWIGAGSVIIPEVKIGKWCTIGAGSVVINDIPDGQTVVGVPAKPVKVGSIN